MSKQETNKVTSAAALIAVIFAAVETAGQSGLSRDDIKAAIDYITSTLED